LKGALKFISNSSSCINYFKVMNKQRIQQGLCMYRYMCACQTNTLTYQYNKAQADNSIYRAKERALG